MMNINSQVKSRERVSAHGEVFTAEREVKAMCDLVGDQCRDYRAAFLEPACGEGNFLAEILRRKLDAIHGQDDYTVKSLIALSSLYGIDILSDNVEACRNRLHDLWSSTYDFTENDEKNAERILKANIVCGDSLHPETITFNEWTFTDKGFTGKKFNLKQEEARVQLELGIPE